MDSYILRASRQLHRGQLLFIVSLKRWSCGFEQGAVVGRQGFYIYAS